MDCLVTKLKGTVNDDSLEFLGSLSIKKTKYSESWDKSACSFRIMSDKEITLHIIGNGNFTDSTGTENLGKDYNVPMSETDIYVSNDDMIINISDKYSLIELHLSPYNANKEGLLSKSVVRGLDSLKYCKKLKTLNLANSSTSGDIEALKDLTELTTLNLTECKSISGNISYLNNLLNLRYLYLTGSGATGDFDSLTNLTELVILWLNSTQILGNVNSLSKMTDLTNLSLADTQIGGNIDDISSPIESITVVESNISGTIEGFVKSQRRAGRNEGSLNNNSNWGDYITFKGNRLGAGQDTLTWTATQITCKGDTITA